MLEAAYRIMADANPYESAGGQDMYVSGLADQTKMDESAAERRQRLTDMGYSSDLGQYADSQSQARGAAYSERSAAQNRNFQASQSYEDRNFRHTEGGLERAFQAGENAKSRAQAAALQGSSQAFQAAQAARAFEYDKVLKGVDSAQKLADKRAAFNSTATGAKMLDADMEKIAAAQRTIGLLDEFEKSAKKTRTGGFVLGNAPGILNWANADYQHLNSITQGLVAANAKMLTGALSDKEGARLEGMGPSIRKFRRANTADIKFLRGVAVRQQDFINAKADARADGTERDFRHEWAAFTNSVPADAGVSFDAWRSRSVVDRNGNPVR
jgi:hypothetical protein